MLRHSLGVFVLALAVFAVLAAACTPSVHGAVDPSRFLAVHRVVVAPFATPPGAPRDLGASFAGELAANLSGARYIVSVDGDPARADAVLLGRVATYRDQSTDTSVETALSVEVRIVDARNGDVILGASAEGTAAETLCGEEMACLRGKLMKEVGKFAAVGAE